jgi:hypothetical protein
MGNTLQKDSTPDSFGTWGAITDLATEDFKLDGGQKFCIINENEDAVMLEVKGSRMTGFVNTKIYPNANLFLVKEIKVNTLLTDPELANLKYGY